MITDIKPNFSVSFIPTNTPLAMRNSKKKNLLQEVGLVYFQLLILAVFAMRQMLVNASVQERVKSLLFPYDPGKQEFWGMQRVLLMS